MGEIHKAPLNSLALDLSRAGGLHDFVETGTYVGDSLDWAARNFKRVWTVEIDERYQVKARERNHEHKNIQYVLGDSATALSRLLSEIRGPALCWLDAHAGAGYFAPNDNCPLLPELDAIMNSSREHCILIDDARAFVAPPPPPFDFSKWPTLEDIFARVVAGSDYHAVIICDALILVPRKYRPLVANFCFRCRPVI